MPRVKPKTELPGSTDYDNFGVARTIATLVLRAAATIPKEMGPDRDRILRSIALAEPMLAGAVYAMVTQIATSQFRLSGPSDKVVIARQVLSNAALGAGFSSFIASLVFSALTSDSGGWFEIVRPAVHIKTSRPVVRTEASETGWADEKGIAVDPMEVTFEFPSLPQTLIPIDPLRCIPTGNPAAPLQYICKDGSRITLEWYQCGRIVDLPIPGQRYGFCAVSRILSAAQLMLDILGWHSDRVHGNLARMLVLTNASPRAIEKALDEASKSSVAAGSTHYVPPVFVSPLDPSATPEAKTIMLADLPPGFNLKDFMEWYITMLAACLGMDYAALAPLPGSRLGTATEAEVMARLSARRGPGYYQRQLEHAVNNLGILPAGVRFEFTVTDYTEEQQRARAALFRAQERATRIGSGELTPTVARQLAADCGDLDPDYLSLFGEKDFSPSDIEVES